jgi:hypothetical protein
MKDSIRFALLYASVYVPLAFGPRVIPKGETREFVYYVGHLVFCVFMATIAARWLTKEVPRG